MSLVRDKEVIDVSESDFIDPTPGMRKWQHFPASYMSHHGEACCDIAREWMLGNDYSQLNAGDVLTGPRWLRQKFAWGPSHWPLYWCDAVERKTLDCGALAALSRELFIGRGVESHPAQLIQQYSDDAARHWHKNWEGDGASAHWIEDDLIYHEGCAVVAPGGEIKIWDSTASWWVNPRQFGGYAGLLVLLVFALAEQASPFFRWGTHCIVPYEWQNI